jgi:3-methylcrotonyl-CoA carboxylase alpha subunit
VLSVAVSRGQAVKRGMPLVVMEAMKMEHTVTAPRDGVVERLCVAAGDQIKEGVELLILT